MKLFHKTSLDRSAAARRVEDARSLSSRSLPRALSFPSRALAQYAHNLDTIGQYESDWTKLAPDMQRARARLREINGDDRGIMTGHQAHHPDRCLGGAPVPTEIDAGFERRRQAMVSHFCAVTHPDFDDGSNPMDVALWLKPAAECRTNTTYVEEE